MSRRQDLAERIQGLRRDQEEELNAEHEEHHARIDALRNEVAEKEKAINERFHTNKARIRERYAKKLDPIVVEHNALLTGEKAARGGR